MLNLGPFHVTMEVSIGVLTVLVAVLGLSFSQWWHHLEERDRFTRLETKVTIMFNWFTRQMRDIPDVRRFFGEADPPSD